MSHTYFASTDPIGHTIVDNQWVVFIVRTSTMIYRKQATKLILIFTGPINPAQISRCLCTIAIEVPKVKYTQTATARLPLKNRSKWPSSGHSFW